MHAKLALGIALCLLGCGGGDDKGAGSGGSGALGGSTATAGASGSGAAAGSAATAPECECAGQCLTPDQIGTTLCADTTTLRAPEGPDCNYVRFVVQGEDYAIYFHYDETGKLVATERAMAGQPRCESGQVPEPCPDAALFDAEQCAVCANASFGNPGNLPECM